MYKHIDNTIYEIPSQKRTMEINQRISRRIVPSANLQPYFSIRPIQTKYTHFLSENPMPDSDTPILREPDYSPSKVFYPGDAQAPWSGFATSINTESMLRNQIYALQSSAAAVFVPDSSSDLYVSNYEQHKDAAHDATNAASFEKHDPNPSPMRVGNLSFNNCTRQQVKTMKC